MYINKKVPKIHEHWTKNHRNPRKSYSTPVEEFWTVEITAVFFYTKKVGRVAEHAWWWKRSKGEAVSNSSPPVSVFPFGKLNAKTKTLWTRSCIGESFVIVCGCLGHLSIRLDYLCFSSKSPKFCWFVFSYFLASTDCHFSHASKLVHFHNLPNKNYRKPKEKEAKRKNKAVQTFEFQMPQDCRLQLQRANVQNSRSNCKKKIRNSGNIFGITCKHFWDKMRANWLMCKHSWHRYKKIERKCKIYMGEVQKIRELPNGWKYRFALIPKGQIPSGWIMPPERDSAD